MTNFFCHLSKSKYLKENVVTHDEDCMFVRGPLACGQYLQGLILRSKWLCNVNVMDGVMTANFYNLFHNTHLTAAASLADTNIFL